MKQLTERQIKLLESIDRRRVAIHEAGHTVIARELGILEFGATLTRCADSDPRESTWWSGQHRARLDRVPRRAQTMYAVAGMVAEICWEGETPLEIDWDDPEILSPTDWGRAGCDPGIPNDALYKAVVSAFAVLNRTDGPLWPDLVREARRLILRFRSSTENALT